MSEKRSPLLCLSTTTIKTGSSSTLIRLGHADILLALKRNLGVNGPGGYNFYRTQLRETVYQQTAQKVGKSKVEEELDRARALFRKYDVNRSGYLEKEEVIPMMRDSYKALKKTFNPSNGEVDQYMKLMDTSGDGRISLDEYEIYILHALQRRNLHF